VFTATVFNTSYIFIPYYTLYSIVDVTNTNEIESSLDNEIDEVLLTQYCVLYWNVWPYTFL